MHTAKDRRMRETSSYDRIKKRERQLSKERTKRQTKNFTDCLKLQIAQKSGRLESSFKQGLHAKLRWIAQRTLRRSCAGLLSVPCGEVALDCSAYLAEKLTDQPVLKVDNNFEELFPVAELGQSKK